MHHTPSRISTVRSETKDYLNSPYGHYCILALVSVDVTAIFAELVLDVLVCEGRVPYKSGTIAQDILGILSKVFSCLFLIELVAGVWAFGWTYFTAFLHVLDATVIITAFVLHVLLKGIVDDISSLVIVLRLWRVVKIISEMSAATQASLEPLEERVEQLESENEKLRGEIDILTRMQEQSESTSTQ
ncbi:hypothetical protein LTR27_009610 [Elasticomyces elasticus]|nr:hypothetical protein LTR27_009610 [Elasticomyces elasticus]